MLRPEAALRRCDRAGREGDPIEIDIPRAPHPLAVADAELARRHCRDGGEGQCGLEAGEAQNAWSPAALQAYAALTTSADTGAVRDVTQVQR